MQLMTIPVETKYKENRRIEEGRWAKNELTLGRKYTHKGNRILERLYLLTIKYGIYLLLKQVYLFVRNKCINSKH